MARHAWLGIGIVLMLVGSACTANGPLVRAAASPSPTLSTVTPSQEATPSPPTPSPTPAPSPVPMSVSCSTTPNADSEPLVMALTSDRQQFQILSLRDPVHPALLCTMAGAGFRFISGTEIGYAASSSLNDPIRSTSVIGRMSLSNLTPVAVVEVQGDVMDFEWSPDGSSLAYLLYTSAPGVGSGAANQL